MSTQREYIGNLDAELMEEYRELVEQGVFHIDGSGNNIIFSDGGSHAIKYPKHEFLSETKSFLLKKEYLIGTDLINNGFRVPQMYAFSPEKEDKLPFLVMEKLNLIYLWWSRKRKVKQFNEQIQRAKDLGYSPSDIFLDHNCGWDKKHKGLYFYDFEYWRGPRVDEIMAGRN